jgi:hypothetical protein
MAPPLGASERKEFNTEGTESTESHREMQGSRLLESLAIWAKANGCGLR